MQVEQDPTTQPMRVRQGSQQVWGRTLMQALMLRRTRMLRQRQRQRNQMKMPSRHDCRNGATGSQRPATRYWEQFHRFSPAA